MAFSAISRATAHLSASRKNVAASCPLHHDFIKPSYKPCMVHMCRFCVCGSIGDVVTCSVMNKSSTTQQHMLSKRGVQASAGYMDSIS